MNWRLNDAVRVMAHNDGAFVVHVPSGRCFSVNVTGATILTQLEGRPRSTEEIVDCLATKFTGDQLPADTHRFLKTLMASGVVACDEN